MFYSVSKDGIVKCADKLYDLPKNDAILCYLRRMDETKIEYITQNDVHYYWYRYEFVDGMGNQVNFKMGTCETTFVEHDDGSYYLRGRRITVRDQYGREGDFGLSGEKGDFADLNLDKIATQLVPYMLKLSSFGGWDSYMVARYPDHPHASRIIWGSHGW